MCMYGGIGDVYVWGYRGCVCMEVYDETSL